MIDVGLSEKIQALKQRFIGPDYHDDAHRQIADWEKRIQELSLNQEFFNNSVAQQIYGVLKKRAEMHITSRLKKGKTPEDFKIADARQEEIEWVLGLFNPGYAEELASLEQLIEAEL